MTDGLSVGAVVANAARACPHADAAFVDGRFHSFAELDSAGTAVARNLVDAGLQPGDVALVVAGVSFGQLAHFVGCARAGVVFAPVNPALDRATVAGIVDTIEPAVQLVGPDEKPVIDPVDLPALWCSSTSPSPEPGRSVGGGLPAVGGDDPHVVFLTSGSTGLPKAVLVSHRTSVLRSHPGAQLEPRGPALCPYPLFHMAGWTISLQQWHARAPIVFVAGTDAPTLIAALREFRVERFNAVPALWSRLADHLEGDAGGALPDLRFADTGTSPTSIELLTAIGELAPNAQVRVFYGSSEAGNVASLDQAEILAKPGRCGLPSVLTEVEIGTDEELLVRGPLLFDRYLGQPEETAAAFRDGWFHTGDRAELDSDGYLSVTGRLGMVIRSGGEAIPPDVVEAALSTHPAVAEVAVFGVPDERWGEIVTAGVVTQAPFTLDDAQAHLGPAGPVSLPRHQHPRRLLLLDELPRTAATQQVDRNRLRELAASTDHESTIREHDG